MTHRGTMRRLARYLSRAVPELTPKATGDEVTIEIASGLREHYRCAGRTWQRRFTMGGLDSGWSAIRVPVSATYPLLPLHIAFFTAPRARDLLRAAAASPSNETTALTQQELDRLQVLFAATTRYLEQLSLDGGAPGGAAVKARDLLQLVHRHQEDGLRP